MKWIQRRTGESMDDEALKDYVRESHRLIFRALPKRVRSELGVVA
jgi:predicted DNA-binding protein (MmcQ/YjbR family)